jgi:hypothetical protein
MSAKSRLNQGSLCAADETCCFDFCCHLPAAAFASISRLPHFLDMSTPVTVEGQELSNDELYLHHYAAIVKKMLEVLRSHRSSPKQKSDSRAELVRILVFKFLQFTISQA